jgi:transcription-repair coupling factor (superfamily II helicase)
MEELGAGFVLATHDLEIRGAGELLGEQQSGQMTEIGLAMYLDMLEQAVEALKEGRKPSLDKPLAAETEVELRLPAFLPEAYVADVHVRLGLYKRIAAAETDEALDELNAEVYDRFGPLPPVAQNLLKLAKLKLAARAIGIRRLDLGAGGGTITFEEKNNLDPMTVVKMIQKNPQVYRLEGSLKLRVARHMPAEEARFEFAADLMKRFAGKAPAADEPAGGGKPNAADKSTTGGKANAADKPATAGRPNAPPPPAARKPPDPPRRR